MVSVCRQCHKTCLNMEEKRHENIEEEEDCKGSWGSLMMMGMCGILPSAIKNSIDPFAPQEPPLISVLPPTPDKKLRNAETDINCCSYIKCNSVSNSSENFSSGTCTGTKNFGSSSVSCTKVSY